MHSTVDSAGFTIEPEALARLESNGPLLIKPPELLPIGVPVGSKFFVYLIIALAVELQKRQNDIDKCMTVRCNLHTSEQFEKIEIG